MSRVGSATCIADNAFPLPTIAALNAYADANLEAAAPGGVTRSGAAVRLAEGVRRSRVLWLPQDVAGTFYPLLADTVRRANAEVFQFDLTGLREQFQLAAYTAEEKGEYGWHVDSGQGRLAHRKISLVIPLTDPAEYEGGRFEAFYNDAPTPIDLPLGRVLMFPSFVLHRVTPVTRGVRRSLAVWVSGPPFR